MRNCAARVALLVVSVLGLFAYGMVYWADQTRSLHADPYGWTPFGIILLCIASCFIPRTGLPLLGAALFAGLVLLAVFWERYDAVVLIIAAFILSVLWWAVYRERSRGWVPPPAPFPRPRPVPVDPVTESADAPQNSKYIRGEIRQKY